MSIYTLEVTEAEELMIRDYAEQIGLPINSVIKETLLDAISYELEELKELQEANEENKRNPNVITFEELCKLLNNYNSQHGKKL